MGERQDVYKRQVLLQKPHPQSLPHREGSFEVTTAAHGLIAVSYTHLDVYKRQVWCPDRPSAVAGS